MRTVCKSISVAAWALASTAMASEMPAASGSHARGAASKPAKAASTEAVFSTGVAKGRDRLDSATSTSAIKGSEVEKFSARSLGEVLRNIPGVRVEYAGGEGNANYTIRGLPLAAQGAKFVQLQEDGMPVLEFGDMQQFTPDTFMRFDLNVAQVEAIRGGSASTFASNGPGGVINLLSKTGDVEGGAVQATLGLNYGEHRVDADYGHKLSDTLRFHVGGFYRRGEGPRQVGFDAYKGGQLKFNITKTFPNGFIRVYGKYLDDRTPTYQPMPLRVTGSNEKPEFSSLANFDIASSSILSPNTTKILTLDNDNKIRRGDARTGQHALVKAAGFDAQFDFGGWSVSNKFRFADISGGNSRLVPQTVDAAPLVAIQTGGPGTTLSYATGPSAGQTIASPSTINGNGLLVSTLITDYTANSLKNVSNDVRVSRIWQIGDGNLTTTAGLYTSAQDYKVDWSFFSILSDLRGGGQTALVNATSAGGVPLTQDGYQNYGAFGGVLRRNYVVKYSLGAPYASVNYHVGKVAIGASARYDLGTARGVLFGAALGGTRVGLAPIDINGDGRIAVPEFQTAVLPLNAPGKVDYTYHYLSYSTGINYRIADPLAVFARYSRGGRAAADRLLFTGPFNADTGRPTETASGFDTVKQTEIGLKLRKHAFTVNITGFSATTGERNTQLGFRGPEDIVRTYSAKGVEVEAAVRHGAFSLTAGGTYTDAKIASDRTHPEVVGHTPRHQASFIFAVTPQIDTKYATFGANLIGTTSSYAQDANQLKLPGYTLVNGFLQVRPTDRVQLMLNVNNVFNTLALAEVTEDTLPPSGIVRGSAYSGRSISASARYSF